MDLYTQLNLQPVQTEPDVWVRRLTIFEQISPEPQIIRDVPLTKGLNIIWAQELSDDDSTEIAGHSAGKTTFCRLIRYVLGEKTYGTKDNMELIQRSLPNAYVGAELFVRHKLWAAVRPIGNGRNSYVKQNATIEEVIADRKHPVYLENYAREIGLESLLDGLETRTIVSTGKPIEWGHILAWFTRDQEARFENHHEWRSHRSESDWPNFRYPSTDPLFVMRCVLGLLMTDELKEEKQLASETDRHAKLIARLDDLKREPRIRLSYYENVLRRLLREALPTEPEIETLPLHWDKLIPDLNRIAGIAVQQIEDDLTALASESDSFQRQIDDIGVQTNQRNSRLRTLDSLFKMEAGVTRELDGATQRQTNRELFDEHGEALCKLGDILYRDCSYVQEHQKRLQVVELQDRRSIKRAKEAQQSIQTQKNALNEEIADLEKQRDALREGRRRISTDIDNYRDKLRAIQNTLQELEEWNARLTKPGESKEIDECQLQIDQTGKKIEAVKAQLNKLLGQHADSGSKLSSIFSRSVKGVLKADSYDGRISLKNRELTFHILHGPLLSGEAVRTLSILLADIACLIYDSVSKTSHLPGFLVHDSPREADLGLGIYHSFLRFVASLAQHFSRGDDCPFQYIITTTTAPPKELRTREFLKLKLNALQHDGLLLGRRIGLTAGQSPELFVE